MSEFGALNLEDFQVEGKRLNTKNNMDAFLEQYVPMPEVKPGQTGIVALRILPPKQGEKLYIATRLHEINGRKYHCPKPLINGKWDKNTLCPICNYYSSLYATADKLEENGQREAAEKLRAEAKGIKPIERYYYNSIVRKLLNKDGEQELNVGPRIFSVGKTVHQMIVRAIIGDDNEPGSQLGDISHPTNGYDFIVRKEIQGQGKEAYPNYNRSSFAKEKSPLGTPEDVKKWGDSLFDLKKFRVIKPIAELETELAIHRGLIPDTKGQEKFNVEEFDAKFRTATSTTTSNTPASVENTSVVETAPATATEDISIGDDEFVAELNAMM